LTVTAAGQVYAVWDESLGNSSPPAAKSGHSEEQGHGHGHALVGDGRAVMLAVASHTDGQFSRAMAVSPRPGAFQLNPAIAIGSDGALLVAWNEIDTTGKRVVVVRHQPEPESHP
jgi:hypothetical protein